VTASFVHGALNSDGCGGCAWNGRLLNCIYLANVELRDRILTEGISYTYTHTYYLCFYLVCHLTLFSNFLFLLSVLFV